jgi:hypothetical protein
MVVKEQHLDWTSMRCGLRLFLGLMLLAFFIQSCKSDNNGSTTTGTTNGNTDTASPPVKAKVYYKINADSAYKFVAAQVAFGPRVPGSSGHKKCLDYLMQKLGEFTDTVQINQGSMKSHTGHYMTVKNLIGSINPKASKRVILAAHYDTRPHADEDPSRPTEPADGANDGASGVGVLLELARQMQINKPAIGIDIIFFDAEDGGLRNGNSETWCLGSQYWAANLHQEDYKAHYGILLDMVGATDAHFAYEAYSINTAQAPMVKVWNMAHQLGYGHYFLSVMGGSITDDHVFVNRGTGIPMIDIIDYDLHNSTGFGSFWHTHEDNMSVIDKKTLNAVGQTVLNVVMQEK